MPCHCQEDGAPFVQVVNWLKGAICNIVQSIFMFKVFLSSDLFSLPTSPKYGLVETLLPRVDGHDELVGRDAVSKEYMMDGFLDKKRISEQVFLDK